jgi:hypothetical protein
MDNFWWFGWETINQYFIMDGTTLIKQVNIIVGYSVRNKTGKYYC